jgi:hypothetical protein
MDALAIYDKVAQSLTPDFAILGPTAMK